MLEILFDKPEKKKKKQNKTKNKVTYILQNFM